MARNPRILHKSTEQLIKGALGKILDRDRAEETIKALFEPSRLCNPTDLVFLDELKLIVPYFSLIGFRSKWKRTGLGNLVLERIVDKEAIDMSVPNEIEAPKTKDPCDWHTHLIDLAKSKEEEIRKGFPDIYKKFHEYDLLQREGFSFSCRRFGDFLTVEIERLANEPHRYSSIQKRMAESFNLRAVSSLKLNIGRDVDHNGKITFLAYQEGAGGSNLSTNSNGIFGSEVSAPPKGSKYVVVPETPDINMHPLLIRDISKIPTKHHYNDYYTDRVQVEFYVDGCPRQSVDDVIHLVGLDIAIPVPFGMGQTVLDQILAEIQRGFPSEPIVIST